MYSDFKYFEIITSVEQCFFLKLFKVRCVQHVGKSNAPSILLWIRLID